MGNIAGGVADSFAHALYVCDRYVGFLVVRTGEWNMVGISKEKNFFF